MINEIKRRLDAGEKVFIECTDREAFLGFKSGIHRERNEEVPSGGLEVTGIEITGTNPFRGVITAKDCATNILLDELKFFKIKDDKKTFHDLVDAVVQAKKDGVVSRIEWNSKGVLCAYRLHDILPFVGAGDSVSGDFIEDAIKTIESCYTETFVIESVKDLQKTNDTSKIVTRFGDVIQGNWSELRWARHNKIEEYDKDSGGYKNHEDSVINLLSYIFRGATVTQKRGK